MFCKFFADKGYIDQDLFMRFFVDYIHLITMIWENMKYSLMHLHDSGCPRNDQS
ncbi:MAG: transposase [Parabacteroides sp.]